MIGIELWNWADVAQMVSDLLNTGMISGYIQIIMALVVAGIAVRMFLSMTSK